MLRRMTERRNQFRETRKEGIVKTRFRKLIHEHDELRQLGKIVVNPDCIGVAFWEGWFDGLHSDADVVKTADHRRICIRCRDNYYFYRAKKGGRRAAMSLEQCIEPRVFALWRAGRISNAVMDNTTAAHRKRCFSCRGEYEFYKSGKT